MTRIVAGRAGGRRLGVPARGTRPTSDRAREGLFSTLDALVGDLAGARVLDLFAGSGALGLEAVSRGAEAAVLVESDPGALRVLRANVRALDLPGVAVVGDRVERHLAGSAETPFDVVLADPPYALDVTPVLAALTVPGWLSPAAVVAVERSRRDPPLAWPPGLLGVRERGYGEAVLWYGRAARTGAPEVS